MNPVPIDTEHRTETRIFTDEELVKISPLLDLIRELVDGRVDDYNRALKYFTDTLHDPSKKPEIAFVFGPQGAEGNMCLNLLAHQILGADTNQAQIIEDQMKSQ